MPSVADVNARFVEEFLRAHAIPVDARSTRRVSAAPGQFFTRSGRALVRTLEGIESVVARERRYRLEL